MLCFASVVAMGFACDCDDDQPASEPDKSSSLDEDEQESTGERDDMSREREAYGLPLPPQVASVDRHPDEVFVITTMSLDELADFYELRLENYEVLRPPGQLRVLGLREYMPEIYGRRFGKTVEMWFTTTRPEPKAGVDGDGIDGDGIEKEGAGAGQGDKQATRESKPLYKREKGEPVMDRTADGELLAPGAKWGEPYTPPPGSPLHKERYKSNWGKPYGEWVAQ